MAVLGEAPSKAGRLDLERRAFLELLRMANALAGPEAIARQLVVLAQHLSNCEAGAIRLKNGTGYPYVALLGFPDNLTTLEDNLCVTYEFGHLLRDQHRQPLLAGLCGKVLSGQFDRQQTNCTNRGSFIASSCGEFLGTHAEPACLGCTGNRCHAGGYETVGLFPIRQDGVTYGLIQCNDGQPGRLTAEAIDMMEHLATS